MNRNAIKGLGLLFVGAVALASCGGTMKVSGRWDIDPSRSKLPPIGKPDYYLDFQDGGRFAGNLIVPVAGTYEVHGSDIEIKLDEGSSVIAMLESGKLKSDAAIHMKGDQAAGTISWQSSQGSGPGFTMVFAKK